MTNIVFNMRNFFFTTCLLLTFTLNLNLFHIYCRISVLASANGEYPNLVSVSILAFTYFGNVSIQNRTENVKIDIILPKNYLFPGKN